MGGTIVNVSAIHLQQTDFVDTVSRILAENGLLSEYLELEIAESAFMDSSYIVTKNSSCLKKKGVKISIIKITVNKALINSVISLGHKIN